MRKNTLKRRALQVVAIAAVAGILASCSQSDTTGTSGDEEVRETSDTAALQNDRIDIVLQEDTASCDSSSVSIDGGTITVMGEGEYVISGTLTDGQIIVDAPDEDTVRLVLDGCDITSSDSAAIYVKSADEVMITLEDGSVNVLANSGTFVTDGDEDVDAVIYSKDDLTIDGSGSLTVTSPAGHGIVSKDDLVIAGGLADITAGSDGIKAKECLTITGGDFSITASEAVEGTVITIEGGTLTINASDDGINASQKSDTLTPSLEISGGDITVIMAQGDTDAVDSNGDIIISGGTIDIRAQSAFDYDGTCEFTGGTVIVNGEQIDTISNQFEAGMMPAQGEMPEDFGVPGQGMGIPEGGEGMGGGMMPPADGAETPPPALPGQNNN